MPIDRKARLLEVRNWDDYYLLTIESPEIGRTAKPGQFVMVKVTDRPFPLLRRPLSIHDAGENGIDLFFKVAGRGTEILSRIKTGDEIDILGPLGKGYSLSAQVSGKRAALVGGGRGIAPLYFLARELEAAGAFVTVYYGGQTQADIPLKSRFEAAGFRTLLSTDDGSYGFRGFVTELLQSELQSENFDLIFSCGPDLMMKAVAGIARTRGIPAEFSLESVMGCGVGACWGCVHLIKSGPEEEWTKVCEEGPVFSGDRIAWTE